MFSVPPNFKPYYSQYSLNLAEMGLFTTINLSIVGFLGDIQVFVDAVLRLVEGVAEEGERSRISRAE